MYNRCGLRFLKEKEMKKLLNNLVLVVALLITTSIPSFAFYSDMNTNHWAYKQIKQMTAKGVVVGYPDGSFHSDENVTRAEFASMAIRALGQEHTTVAQPVNFTDITPDFWAYDMIQRALYFELISCPPEGKAFRPDDSVSHAEAVSVIVNALTTENIT